MSSEAQSITRKAKSNLAFALRVLPPAQRADAVTFYAFCRRVDDIADDPDIPLDERRAGLDAWSTGLTSGFDDPSEIQQATVDLRDRLAIPNELLSEIIDGCRADLRPQRFETWADLQQYTHKVACAVGLVSIRIFGCTDPGSESYAIALGHALQLTNIIRDVGEDLSNGGRIYLPLGDLARFQYTEHDLVGRVHDERFVQLMNFQADRADELFRQATGLLPATDRRALRPAEIMRSIYSTLLDKMRADSFRVFDRRYQLSKPRMLAILARQMLGAG
jgi:phytoene synthase